MAPRNSISTAGPRLSSLAMLGLILALLLSSASAQAEEQPQIFNIQGTLRVPQGAPLAEARVLLNGGQFLGLVRRDRSFVLHDVPTGVHLLEVSLMGFQFDPVRLEISVRDGQGRIRATAHGQKLQYPLSLTPVPVSYFEEYQPINVLGMLKNPMVLMLLATVVMAVVFPKLMANMSPEELEEMKQQQAKFGMTNFMKQAEALRS